MVHHLLDFAENGPFATVANFQLTKDHLWDAKHSCKRSVTNKSQRVAN